MSRGTIEPKPGVNASEGNHDRLGYEQTVKMYNDFRLDGKVTFGCLERDKFGHAPTELVDDKYWHWLSEQTGMSVVLLYGRHTDDRIPGDEIALRALLLLENTEDLQQLAEEIDYQVLAVSRFNSFYDGLELCSAEVITDSGDHTLPLYDRGISETNTFATSAACVSTEHNGSACKPYTLDDPQTATTVLKKYIYKRQHPTTTVS